MTTTTFDDQHIQAAENISVVMADDQPQEKCLPSLSDDAILFTKSGVRVNPGAAMVSPELSITYAILSHNALGKRALQEGRRCSEANLCQRHTHQGCLHHIRQQTQSYGLC